MKLVNRAVSFGLASLLTIRMGVIPVISEDPTHLVTRCPFGTIATTNSKMICVCSVAEVGQECFAGDDFEKDRSAVCIQDLTSKKQPAVCAWEYHLPQTTPFCPPATTQVATTSDYYFCADSASKYSCGAEEQVNCQGIPNVLDTSCIDAERCGILSCKAGYRFKWIGEKEGCVLSKPLFSG